MRLKRRHVVVVSLLLAFVFFIWWVRAWLEPYEPTSRRALEKEFYSEFGFNPSADIKEIHCRIVTIGDTWSKWIVFTYNKNTVVEVLNEGFTEATSQQLNSSTWPVWRSDLSEHNPNEPQWWRLPSINRVAVYYKEGSPRDFAGFTYLWVDESAHLVYVKSAAWH